MNYPQIKPTLNLDFSNTKTLDPRINFRRGTPGAYYDGKTYAKAEENLISYSEDFSNAYWTSSRAILTGGQDAPDGTSSAYKLQQEIGQTNAGTIRLTDPLTLVDNKEYTVSIYAKAGTNRNYLVLFTNLTADRELTFFDLSSGEVVNVNDRHTAAIQSAGNDWYRCSITYTPNIAEIGYVSAWNFYFTDNDTTRNPVADDSGFIYIWGAQLEQRDSVTAYTPTSGTPITKYQPQLMFASPDQPRFDHDPLTGESKGLLIEESRTNLVWYSESFGDIAIKGTPIPESAWQYIRCSLDTNGPISPDGTTRSVIMKHDTDETSGGGLYMSTYSGLDDKYIPAGTNTYSWYAKNAGVNFFVINTGGNKVFFDLTNGTAKSFATLIDSYGIEHVGNGWYRCHVVTSQATGLYFYQSDQDDDGTLTVSGAGGVAVWGPQFEQGSFPTSYIKTSGASATRSADDASITGENFSSWYRQDEGSLYSEISTFDTSGTASRSRITLGSGVDRVFSANGENSLYVETSSGATQVQINNSLITNVYYKKAIGLKKDDFAISFEGNIKTDADGLVPLVDSLYFKEPINSVAYLNGHIKKLSYYSQRLTNEQLQQLTK